MAAKLTCEIAMCGAELPEGTGSQGGLMLCRNCRSAQYRARKLGGDWLIARAERLQLWDERITYLAPIVSRNNRVKEQLAELHDRVSRTAAAKLGEARAAARAAMKRRTRTGAEARAH